MLFYSVVILLWIFIVGQLASVVINKFHLFILSGNVSVLDMIMENEICCIDSFKWETHLISTHIDMDACVESFIIQLDSLNTGVSIVLWKKFVYCVLFFLALFFPCCNMQNGFSVSENIILICLLLKILAYNFFYFISVIFVHYFFFKLIYFTLEFSQVCES